MRRIIAIMLSVCVLLTEAYALDLDYEAGVGSYVRQSEMTIADGTELHSNMLIHSAAGLTEERYIEYTPGSYVMPVVSYGSVLYGMSTISYVSDYMRAQGNTVVAGVNGDFFMMDTGIPIGLTVTDGILRSSDAGVNAVGFHADGSAFIGKPALDIEVKTDTGYSLKINYVNKTRKNYGVYLLTPDYSHSTRTTAEGTTIILKNISGDLKIGGTVTATVDSVVKGSAPVELTEGTMVLTATEENGLAARLDGVAASSQVTISITSPDSRWNEAVYAVGAGDMLVRSGQIVQGLGTAAAPRTAFGVTAEGKLVFYTVDGRQTGYSNGMGMSTLAERMKSLGCVEAVNLDGGGSTAITAQYPGFGSTETINHPSDGSLRKCANYILFINKAGQTSVPASLHLYPFDPIVLANSSFNFDVKAADSGYFPAELPEGISFSLDSRLGIIDQNGVFTAGGDEGRINITAAGGGLAANTSVTVVKAPSSVSLVNASSGASVTSIKAEPLQTIDLNAVCYFDGVKMISSDSALNWEISNDVGNIGSIDANGVFTASEMPGSKGRITVYSGDIKCQITVSIGSEDKEIDPFENSSSALISDSDMLTTDIQTDKNYVRYGSGSARFSYDFNAAADEKLGASAGWKMPANGRYLKFWLYGDNSGNLFGVKAKKSNGEIADIPVCTLDFTGYKPMAVELTPDISEISGIYIQKSGELTGTVYIDQMTVSYSSDADLTAPNIEILSVGTVNSGGLTELRAKITDNGYMPINKDNLQLSLDGQEIAFSYSDITAELTSEFEHPNDGLIHRLTIRAEDASGNISTASYDLDAAAESVSAFEDTFGHWSGKYANFLNARGVINGRLNDDRRYFYPDTVMTRAEFAVMMTKYLGINPENYKDTALIYSDTDNIPGWARNAVAAMYVTGVIKGKNIENEIRFEPSAPVTRAEMMTVLGRTLPKGLGSAEISFKDGSSIPKYAAEYVGILVKMNIVTGYSDRTVRPTGNVRRGEAAKMLYGLY